MSCPDHFHQFSGGDHGVNVVSRIFLIEQFHLTLALLGYTGHHGYRIDLLRLHPKLLGKIGLHHSPEHLLRRLGRRDLFQEMGELGLGKPDPPRTAGGKHWEFLQFSGCKPLQEFIGFLHNGKVRGKYGVKYIVHSHLLHSVKDLADGCILRRKTKALTPGSPHGRRHLCHNDLVFILNGSPYLLCIVPCA